MPSFVSRTGLARQHAYVIIRSDAGSDFNRIKGGDSAAKWSYGPARPYTPQALGQTGTGSERLEDRGTLRRPAGGSWDRASRGKMHQSFHLFSRGHCLARGLFFVILLPEKKGVKLHIEIP